MRFEQALEAMDRGGAKVKRADWRGTWVCYGEGNPALPADKFWNKHTRALAEANGGVAEVLPYFIRGNGIGQVQMGWSPSQADVLADDWEIVP